MRNLHTLLAGAASVILGAACLTGAALPTAAEAKPAQQKVAAGAQKSPPGRLMRAAELRRLYSGKTWIWANGGGYMDPSGRFSAAIGGDRARASYAQGTWQANGKGQMCFAGLWRTDAKRSRGRTCFTHRIAGDTIYQRKEPSGSWYAFKHSPARESDEFSKLVQGNRIADQLRQVQAALAAN